MIESSKENIRVDYEEEEPVNIRAKTPQKIPLKRTAVMTSKKDNTPISKSKTVVMNKKDLTAKKSYALRERQVEEEEAENQVDVQELELYYQQQIKGLHEKLENLYKDQTEVIHKYEKDDQYWKKMHASQEQKIAELMQQNHDLHVKNVKARGSHENHVREIESLNQILGELKSKKDKKEDLIEEQQRRISDLLRENGEFNKELAMRLEEISNLKAAVSTAEGRVAELKAIIRENERNLTDLHTQALQHNTINIQRSEDLQRRYDDLEKQLDERTKELRNVLDKNAELVGMVAGWERKYEDRVNEINRGEQARLRALENEYKEKIEDMERAHEREMTRNEEKFKESMDVLEEEFKKVLLENNDKFKMLKSAFEEKCKVETELKQLLKVISSKNIEFEKIIDQQNDMLEKMSKEHFKMIQEKDTIIKSVKFFGGNLLTVLQNEEKIASLKSNTTIHQASAERLQGERDMFERLNKDLENQVIEKAREVTNLKKKLAELESSIESLTEEVDKWRQRATTAENRSEDELRDAMEQIEDLKDNIETKNRMLEDKNVTIEELKEQLMAKQEEIEYVKSAKNDTQGLEEELEKQKHQNEKLQRKVDKASDYISEMKKGIADLEEELARRDENIAGLESQLDKKNQVDRDLRDIIKYFLT